MKKRILILLFIVFISSAFAYSSTADFDALTPAFKSINGVNYKRYSNSYEQYFSSYKDYIANPSSEPLETLIFYVRKDVSGAVAYLLYTTGTGRYDNVGEYYVYYYPVSTLPICTPPEVFSYQNGCSVPTCQDGYTLQSDNSCKPDINCPPSMDYFYSKNSWYQFNTSTCILSHKNKADCEAVGGTYYANGNKDLHLSLNDSLHLLVGDSSKFLAGGNCGDDDYLSKRAQNQDINTAIGFNPYGGIANMEKDFLGHYINKLFGWGKNKLFSVGKNFWSAVQNAMPSGKGLNEIQPDIINMDVGDDGVTYEVTPTPKTPTPPDGGTWLDVYNNYTNNGGKFPDAPVGSVDGAKDVPDFQINRPSFFVNPSPDTYYNGNDATSFKDNNIITSNMITDNLLPDNIDRHFDDASGVPFDTSYTVKPDFLKNKTAVSYPAKFVKTKMERIGTNQIQRTFKGTVTLPDNSVTNVKLISTTNADGTITQDSTVSYPVETENGNKIFHNNYVVNKSASGEITSSFRNPSNISHVDDSGAVVTTTNSDYNSAPTTEETKPVIDLSGVNSKLDSIKDDLDVIDADIKEGLTFKPDNAEIGKSTITDFGTASDLFDVNFHTYLNFLNGIKQNMSDLHTQFVDTKALLENKPVVNQINGTCGFNTTLYFTQIHVDPCAFVLPYRPILSMFFTLFATFGVLMFGIKFSLLGGK